MGNCSSERSVLLIETAYKPTTIDFQKLVNEQIVFTDEEIAAIKSSWNRIEHNEFGVNLMVRIFVKYPALKEKWIFAIGLTTEEEMRQNSQVNYHAKKIISLLNSLINEELARINTADLKKLVQLGKNHFGYGVAPEDFEGFRVCFYYCLEQTLGSEHYHRTAWDKLYLTIVKNLVIGIYQAQLSDFGTGK